MHMNNRIYSCQANHRVLKGDPECLCRASPELAAWIGKDNVSRPEITKFFWEYVKENEVRFRLEGCVF